MSSLARIKPSFFFQSLRTGIQQVRSIQSANADSTQPFTVKLDENSFHSHLCEMPGLDVEVTKDGLLTMYREMQTMRRMEMAADALYKAKLIRGFCHLAIGQVSNRYLIRVGDCWYRFLPGDEPRKLSQLVLSMESPKMIALSPHTGVTLSRSCVAGPLKELSVSC